ncbi:MAG: c-type cytochrome [Syntrophothermus sp.]
MTKTQIWIFAFLGVFLLLFGISYLTWEDKAPSPGSPMMGGAPQDETVQQAGKELSAMDLIKKNGCTGCHGTDLNGGNMGPSLVNVKQYWGRDELISYLRNPNSFMDKDRFQAYKQKFSTVSMPPYNNLDIKDLGKIADYLIKK